MTRVWLTVFIGHKYLYENGILHRDISAGNILIKWWPGSEAGQPGTSGCLIDLDHAKRGKPSSEQVAAQRVENKLHYLVDVWCSEKRIDMGVAREASVFFPVTDDDDDDNTGSIINYLKAALAHISRFRPLNGQLCTSQHLGWKPVRGHCILLCGSDYRHY